MELLFVSHKHPPSIGGIQVQNKALVDGMARHARVHRLIWDGRSSLAAFLASVPLRVRRLLHEHPSIAAIHLCDGLMGIVGFAIRELTDVPVVLTVHGLDVVLPSRLYREQVVRRFDQFSAVVAVSHDTARACRERGISPEKLHVVHNGVGAEFAHATPDPAFRARLSERLGIPLSERRILVHTGRAVRRKGLSWFVREVLPRLPSDVVLLMIGPRDAQLAARRARLLAPLSPTRRDALAQFLAWPLDEPAIVAALASPALHGRAFELGSLPFAELLQTVLLADVFVMPNLEVPGDSEGFGLVAVEAASAAVPVVASGIEGLAEAIVDGKSGHLLPPGDSQRWVDELRALLDAPEARRAFGRAAQAYTREHNTNERMVLGYLEVFRSVAQAR
jgi:glycosyltransferase involved in cell wall biosynthesis